MQKTNLTRRAQGALFLGAAVVLSCGLLLAGCNKSSGCQDCGSSSGPAASPITPVHEITVKNMAGEEQKLESYQGKVLLIVNVASRCGYTPQYKPLQELHEAYQERGLVVMGFPANNFGGQEPGSNQEIQTFCETKFGVTFPMFEKISVKGADQHPLYRTLTGEQGDVTWNFNKFLVSPDGKVVKRFDSGVDPMGQELRTAIEQLLPVSQ